MPQTFPTLAALIPKELPVELRCYDEGIQTIDPERLQADLVGMTVITGSAPRAYDLAAVFRARGIPVVMGGPHITLAPEDARPHADVLVRGLAEVTWPQLLRDWFDGTMADDYHEQPPFELHSPRADRTVLPRHKYLTDAVFEATRGCHHSCEFCASPAAWGRKVWFKPIPHVIEDIRLHGKKRIIFIDLNLISSRKYACELFHALIPLGIKWFGLSTSRIADDPELLDLCARSGCSGLLIGLESIDPTALNQMGKTFNRPDQYARLVETLHRNNIALQGCFVFGNDGETDSVFEKTADFAIEAGIDLPRFAISTPFPGTPLYKRMEQESRLLHKDWSLYDGQHCVFQPTGMSPQDVEAGAEAAWKKAYSFKGCYQRIRQSPVSLPLAVVTNWTYRRYAHNLHKFYTCDWGLAR
jgi:radical SAM superfamily enzyme YgiQ (UPF0313 family)